MNSIIPEEVKTIAQTLEGAKFQAYLVGGCVRDILLDRVPKDWDVATNARPDEVQKLFPNSVYENDFGTVLVKVPKNKETSDKDSKLEKENPFSMSHSPLSVVEVTTFRLEGKYTDKRHPDKIKFAKTIEEDLSRRDFTVNAMAFELNDGKRHATSSEKPLSHVSFPMSLVDPYGGQKDIKDKIIRTVGVAEERFNEDALRLIRAVRFIAQLDDFSVSTEDRSPLGGEGGPAVRLSSPSKSSGWEIEMNTRRAIGKLSGFLEAIAKERIRDEFVKIIMSQNATRGLLLLEELNLLRNVVPELREGIGVGQNKHHTFTVFEHNIRALDYAAKKNYSLKVRLASLFHDVGKTRAKQGDGPDSTFYNHEMIGAKMTLKIMDRLRFPKDITEEVTHLVRNHLFYYNVDEVTAAGVRRLLRRVGPENVDDLMKVREADRIGSGVPKAVPYKLRHLLFMIEKVKNDPLSPKMLKVNGEDVMKILEISPGPKVGQILNILLEVVLDDPELNTKKYLESEIKKLGKLPEKKLQEMMKEAKKKAESVEKGIEEEIKKKYYVK